MGDVYSRFEPVLCRNWLMKQTAASSQEIRQETSYYEPHGMCQQLSGNTTAVYYALHFHFFSVSYSLLNIQQFSFSSPSNVPMLGVIFSFCQVTVGFL